MWEAWLRRPEAFAGLAAAAAGVGLAVARRNGAGFRRRRGSARVDLARRRAGNACCPRVMWLALDPRARPSGPPLKPVVEFRGWCARMRRKPADSSGASVVGSLSACLGHPALRRCAASTLSRNSRRNEKPTGARMPLGKLIARQNGFKRGLSGRDAGRQKAEFAAHLRRVRNAVAERRKGAGPVSPPFRLHAERDDDQPDQLRPQREVQLMPVRGQPKARRWRIGRHRPRPARWTSGSAPDC
jgi:hypothetical protein